MRLFRCRHPLSRLDVQKDETVERIDRHHDEVTYHFFCNKCGKQLKLGYIRLTKAGKEAFGIK